MAKVRRPMGYVELDEHGNEISDFGKGIEEIVKSNTSNDEAEVQDELTKLFGEDAVKEFGKGDGLPTDVNGNPIDNHKVEIKNVRPSVVIHSEKSEKK